MDYLCYQSNIRKGIAVLFLMTSTSLHAQEVYSLEECSVPLQEAVTALDAANLASDQSKWCKATEHLQTSLALVTQAQIPCKEHMAETAGAMYEMVSGFFRESQKLCGSWQKAADDRSCMEIATSIKENLTEARSEARKENFCSTVVFSRIALEDAKMLEDQCDQDVKSLMDVITNTRQIAEDACSS